MTQNEQTFKRAASVALVGLFTQLGLAIIMAVLGLYAQSDALHAATWYLFGGLPIWIVLWVLFNQHRLERVEALEAEQIAQDDAQAAALFQEAGQQLAMARKRLDNIYKWGLSLTAGLVSLYLIVLGATLYYVTPYLDKTSLDTDPNNLSAVNDLPISPTASFGIVIMLLVTLAFVAFLVARYIAGMTDVREWLALRAGSAYLMGNALVSALLAAAAILVIASGNPIGFAILAKAIPIFMVILGVEIALALLLGIYRPRKPGEFVRPAFDSRLLGWLTRPESLGKIVGDTINYQFGFEISSSWFYRLLAQWTLPLILVCVFVVMAMSTIVFVAPQQNAVITTFGQLERVVDPGLRLKWPWPISAAEKYDVNRVHQITLGSRGERAKENIPVLWTNEHTEGDEIYLVTAPTRFEDEFVLTEIVAGELIGADVVVKYRIADLEQYVRSARQPEAMLEAIAEARINAYFATHQIDVLLTLGRLTAGDELLRQIREAVEAEKLGLEVVFVSVSGVHPPQVGDVAAAFHQQIDVLQEKQTAIQKAEREAITILAAVAGTRDKALQISTAIEELNDLRQRMLQSEGQNLTEEQEADLTRKAAEIEELLDAAGGEAAEQILAARAFRWDTAIAELARAESFSSQLTAYRQAPEYYKARMYLNALAEALKNRRKIILDLEENDVPTIRLDLKEGAGGFDELLNPDR